MATAVSKIVAVYSRVW